MEGVYNTLYNTKTWSKYLFIYEKKSFRERKMEAEKCRKMPSL